LRASRDAAVIAVIVAISLWGWLHAAPPEPRKIVRLTTTLPVAAVNGALVPSHAHPWQPV